MQKGEHWYIIKVLGYSFVFFWIIIREKISVCIAYNTYSGYSIYALSISTDVYKNSLVNRGYWKPWNQRKSSGISQTSLFLMPGTKVINILFRFFFYFFLRSKTTLHSRHIVLGNFRTRRQRSKINLHIMTSYPWAIKANP